MLYGIVAQREADRLDVIINSLHKRWVAILETMVEAALSPALGEAALFSTTEAGLINRLFPNGIRADGIRKLCRADTSGRPGGRAEFMGYGGPGGI